MSSLHNFKVVGYVDTSCNWSIGVRGSDGWSTRSIKLSGLRPPVIRGTFKFIELYHGYAATKVASFECGGEKFEMTIRHFSTVLEKAKDYLVDDGWEFTIFPVKTGGSLHWEIIEGDFIEQSYYHRDIIDTIFGHDVGQDDVIDCKELMNAMPIEYMFGGFEH